MVVHSNYHRYLEAKRELSIFRWLVHRYMTSIANFVSTFEAIEITKLVFVGYLLVHIFFFMDGFYQSSYLGG